MLCHLSALAGLFLPVGNILGPLLVWQIKKNEMPAVEPHGKDSLNFQLTVLIITLIAAALHFHQVSRYRAYRSGVSACEMASKMWALPGSGTPVA